MALLLPQRQREYHRKAGAIRWAAERGIAAGKTAATFDPSGACTRGQAVTFLWRAAGKPEVSSGAAFSDVAADAYCAQAVRWAASLGIVTGYADGNFRPNATVTREQMAAILYRYAQYKGYDVTASGDLSGYTDAGAIRPYAEAAMAWANGAGLITGVSDTTLQPRGNSTRAQVATILMRFCQKVAE